MPPRTLQVGDAVRARDGVRGRVVRPSPVHPLLGASEYRYFDVNGKSDVVAYTVLTESGEIREYAFEALTLDS